MSRSLISRLLLGLAQPVLGVGQLRAQRVALGARLVALVLGVDRVAEPAEQVAERLQDAARALLDRRERAERTALRGMQAGRPGTLRNRR